LRTEATTLPSGSVASAIGGVEERVMNKGPVLMSSMDSASTQPYSSVSLVFEVLSDSESA